MFPRNSLTPRAAHPLPPLPRFFVCACARVDVARPRCEAAEITGSLLRPPAANPKEANAMSERSLRINSDDGGGKESSGWRRMEAEFISGRGREKREGTENKKLPITADRNPYTDPLRPILVVISFDFFPSRVFSFDDGFGGWLSWKICFGKLRIWNNSQFKRTGLSKEFSPFRTMETILTIIYKII